jgi:hypothetical protein
MACRGATSLSRLSPTPRTYGPDQLFGSQQPLLRGSAAAAAAGDSYDHGPADCRLPETGEMHRRHLRILLLLSGCHPLRASEPSGAPECTAMRPGPTWLTRRRGLISTACRRTTPAEPMRVASSRGPLQSRKPHVHTTAPHQHNSLSDLRCSRQRDCHTALATCAVQQQSCAL